MQLNAVIDYIFSIKIDTVMGQKLKVAATKKAKPVLDANQQKEEDYRNDIKDICSYDALNNICWIDYGSWKALPKKMRICIQDLIAPKSWRGVVFPFDQWLQNEHEIIVNLHPDIVLILTKDVRKKYRIYTIPIYKSYLDWVSPLRFQEITQKINNSAVKTYGRFQDSIYILNNSNGNNDVEEISIFKSRIS